MSALRKFFTIAAKHCDLIETISVEGELPLNDIEADKGFDLLCDYGVAYRTSQNSVRLVSDFQAFIDLVLKTDSLSSVNIDVSTIWNRIKHNIKAYNELTSSGQFEDALKSKRSIEDSVYQMVEGLKRNVELLRKRIENDFGYVTSLSAKKKENDLALYEADKLISSLKIINVEEVLELTNGSSEFYLLFRNDLMNGQLMALEGLNKAIDVMKAHMFRYRKLEDRAKSFKRFKAFVDENVGLQALDEAFPFDNEVSVLPDLLNVSFMENLTSYPDPDQPILRDAYIDIVESIQLDKNRVEPVKACEPSLGVINETTSDIVLEEPKSRLWIEKLLIATIECKPNKIAVCDTYDAMEMQVTLHDYLDVMYCELLNLPSSKSTHFEINTLGDEHPIYNGNFDINEMTICCKV